MSEGSRRTPSRMLRGRALASAIVAVCIVVYAVVVGLYALNDQTTRTDGCTDELDESKVVLVIAPQTMDANLDRLIATVDIPSFGPVGAGSVPREDLTLVIAGTAGSRTYEFAAGSVVSSTSVDIITEGSVEAWPFDVHTADVGVALLRGSTSAATETVPVDICVTVHVPGWAITTAELPSSGGGETSVHLDARRSAATIAFGIVLLALMVVLPVLGITVAVTVLRGRRKVEATLTSWLAAMLFAIVPLRTFLPGSPPIGSWVDYTVVLWVVAGLVAALVIYVIAWLRWAPPGGAPEP